MNKRGESVVEVVVACGILSLLFTSVATIIAGSVGLNNDSRIRMESVSIAQTSLNEFIVSGKAGSSLQTGSCLISQTSEIPTLPVPPKPVSGDISGDTACSVNLAAGALKAHLELITSDKCGFITLRKPTEEESGGALGFQNNFTVVESHIKWLDRAQVIQEYVITKLVAGK